MKKKNKNKNKNNYVKDLSVFCCPDCSTLEFDVLVKFDTVDFD